MHSHTKFMRKSLIMFNYVFVSCQIYFFQHSFLTFSHFKMPFYIFIPMQLKCLINSFTFKLLIMTEVRSKRCALFRLGELFHPELVF